MNAIISPQQCEKNQQRGMFSCSACPGLADAVEIDLEEVIGMTVQRCKIEGCEKTSQAGKDGMCRAHWREVTGTPRRQWGSNRAAKPEIETSALPAAPVVTHMRSARGPKFETETTAEYPATPVRGLAGLLASDGLSMSIPWPLADRMAANDVTVDDVVELIEMLLDGHLRKVT